MQGGFGFCVVMIYEGPIECISCSSVVCLLKRGSCNVFDEKLDFVSLNSALVDIDPVLL